MPGDTYIIQLLQLLCAIQVVHEFDYANLNHVGGDQRN